MLITEKFAEWVRIQPEKIYTYYEDREWSYQSFFLQRQSVLLLIFNSEDIKKEILSPFML